MPFFTSELPKDKCIVKLEWEAAARGGERARDKPEELLKDVSLHICYFIKVTIDRSTCYHILLLLIQWLASRVSLFQGLRLPFRGLFYLYTKTHLDGSFQRFIRYGGLINDCRRVIFV